MGEGEINRARVLANKTSAQPPAEEGQERRRKSRDQRKKEGMENQPTEDRGRLAGGHYIVVWVYGVK